MMPANTTSLVIAITITTLGVGGLAIGAVRYMRATNILCNFILKNGPNLWTNLIEPHNPDRLSSVIPYQWIFRVMIGIRILDIPGERYQELLGIARKWLIVCAVFWMAGIIGLGWLFQNIR